MVDSALARHSPVIAESMEMRRSRIRASSGIPGCFPTISRSTSTSAWSSKDLLNEQRHDAVRWHPFDELLDGGGFVSHFVLLFGAGVPNFGTGSLSRFARSRPRFSDTARSTTICWRAGSSIAKNLSGFSRCVFGEF